MSKSGTLLTWKLCRFAYFQEAACEELMQMLHFFKIQTQLRPVNEIQNI